MPTPEGLLTMAEAATLANRTSSTISLWARKGHIPFTRATINYRPVLLFHPDDVARISAAKQKMCEERNYRGSKANAEETMEDLERLIAEQSRNLPDWWVEHTERMKKASVKDLLRGADDECD